MTTRAITDWTIEAARGALFAAAQRVLRDPAAAEDVVQDVFMTLWRNPKGFDASRSSLSHYLTMLARSRALELLAAVGIPDAESRRLLRAVDTLPADQREALLLAYGRGLTANEISEAARVPLGTAKSRLRLGLEKARSALEVA